MFVSFEAASKCACHRKVFICGQGAFLFFRTIFVLLFLWQSPPLFCEPEGGKLKQNAILTLEEAILPLLCTAVSSVWEIGGSVRSGFFWARGREGGRSDD